MRSFRIIISLIVLATTISAQSVGQWKIFSSLSNIRSAVYSQETMWAAASGGLFSFNPPDSNYSIFTKADGLSSQALSSLGVDAQGKIWLGSEEGYINVLDPSTLALQKIVDIYNSDYSQKQINSIFFKGDSVFVSTQFGLSILNSENLSFYDTFIKLGSFNSGLNIVSSFKTSLVFAITSDGIAVQKTGTTNLSAPESWNSFYFSSDIAASSASKILQYNGTLLLATNNGVMQYINNTWQQILLSGYDIIDMITSGNSLYLITPHELYQYSNGSLSLIYSNTYATFISVAEGPNQSIYISSNSGLVSFKGSVAKNNFPNGPLNNSFTNLSVDPLGRLFVATGKDAAGAGAGFFKYEKGTWTNYNTNSYPQLPSNSYYNVFAAPDSAVYLSNWGKGVTVLKNNKFTTYNGSNSPLVGITNDATFISISDVKTDSKGNVWILNNETASQAPLSVLTKDNKWYSFTFSNPVIGSDPTGNLVVDAYDTKWFAITDTHRGLYYFNENSTFSTTNDDTKGELTTNDDLVSNLVTALAVDQRGYVWVGTNLGMNVIIDPQNPKASNAVRSIYALTNQPVTCIAVDPLDQKWVGTTSGVFLLSSDGYTLFKQYTTLNSPLPDNNINSIAFDNKNGIVYIGTNKGLASLQTSSVEPVESFGELFIYPNPFIVGNGDNKNITIDGLIRNTSLKVFNISGGLVREFDSPGGRLAFWDGKDTNGDLVPSGVYIIVAYDTEANDVKTSKVAVIRK
jgi:ligand-binding sensor domain-containing protein